MLYTRVNTVSMSLKVSMITKISSIYNTTLGVGHMRFHLCFRKMCMTSLIIFSCLCFFQPTTVKANYYNDFYDGLQQFSELPAELNKLKDSYEETRKELEQAKASAQAYEQQNAQLIEQNRQLTETVQLLNEAELSRQNRSKQIRSVVMWAIGLAVGYFLLTRTIRLVMKRSNRTTKW